MSGTVQPKVALPDLHYSEAGGLTNANEFHGVMLANGPQQLALPAKCETRFDTDGNPLPSPLVRTEDGRKVPASTRTVVDSVNKKTQEVVGQRVVYSGQFDTLPKALADQLTPFMLANNKDPEYNAATFKPVLQEINKQIFVVTDLLKNGNERLVGMGASAIGHGLAPDGSIHPAHYEQHLVGIRGSSVQVKEARLNFASDAGAHLYGVSNDPRNELPDGAHNRRNNQTDWMSAGPIDETTKTRRMNEGLKADINLGHGLPANSPIDKPLTLVASPAMQAAAETYQQLARSSVFLMKVPYYDNVGNDDDLVRAELMPKTAHKTGSELTASEQKQWSSNKQTFGMEVNKENLKSLVINHYNIPADSPITTGPAMALMPSLLKAAQVYDKYTTGNTEQLAQGIRLANKLGIDTGPLIGQRMYPEVTKNKGIEDAEEIFPAEASSKTPLFDWNMNLQRNKQGVVLTSDHPMGTSTQKGTFTEGGPHIDIRHPRDKTESDARIGSAVLATHYYTTQSVPAESHPTSPLAWGQSGMTQPLSEVVPGSVYEPAPDRTPAPHRLQGSELGNARIDDTRPRTPPPGV